MMTPECTVGTASAARGELAVGVIPVDQLSLGQPVDIPVIVAHGGHPGPTLWLNAGLHGNELNGIQVVSEVTNNLDLAALRGTVIGTPAANPLAVQSVSRLTPHDGANLGECYPGDRSGTITARVAAAHFEQIAVHADYLIDLHASGVTHRSRPYTVFKFSGQPDAEERGLALMHSLGIFLNCTVDTLRPTDEPVPLTGSLDLACMAAGIPAFMAEIGTACRLEPDIVATITERIGNAMTHLGMLDGEAQHFDTVTAARRFIVRCQHSGIVVHHHHPYDHVQPGQPIALVQDIYGRTVETVRAPEDLYLISLKEDAIVTAGDRVAFCASTTPAPRSVESSHDQRRTATTNPRRPPTAAK